MVVYAKGQYVTVTGPETFVLGWFPSALPAILTPLTVDTAGKMQGQAQAAFPWEPMASHFEPQAEVGPGAAFLSGLSSEDPILPFVNYDVRAHWPPFGAGSAFARWATRHNQIPVRAAWAYAQRDHPGSKAMERIQAEAGTVLEQDLEAALTALLSG